MIIYFNHKNFYDKLMDNRGRRGKVIEQTSR